MVPISNVIRDRVWEAQPKRQNAKLSEKIFRAVITDTSIIVTAALTREKPAHPVPGLLLETTALLRNHKPLGSCILTSVIQWSLIGSLSCANITTG